MASAITGVLAASLVACGKSADNNAPSPDAKSSLGNELDDALITTRVKSALMTDLKFKNYDIKVETRKGEVLLSGFVDNQAELDEGWALYHSGEFERAAAIGLLHGAEGLALANQATAIYANYLEPREAVRLSMFRQVVERAGARAAAEGRGKDYDEEADAGMRAFIEASVEEQSLPHFLSGMLYDDGVIDPRDTRTVLGICLSVIDTSTFSGTDRFGVFRM
eukprot:gene15011-17209_t